VRGIVAEHAENCKKWLPDRYDVEERLEVDLPIAVCRNSLLAANQFSTVLLHNKRF
jgi:hypothetical protein